MMRAKCKVCKSPAKYKTSDMKYHCGNPPCVMELHMAMKEKAIKKSLKERKEKLDETVPIWTKKAQTAFNAYIRYRDKDKPCISCGKMTPPKKYSYRGNGTWDAGHYRSIGSCPELRFNELNCHRQHSRPCNKDLSGDAVNYRNGLIGRIGISALEDIEGPHEPKRYRVDDLKKITQYYKTELKKLKELD